MDRGKIEELIGLYREGLIFFIHRYVNDLDVAEDLAEDVFVELIVNPKGFKGASSEKTYLYSIGKNKAIDYIRHSKVKESHIKIVGAEETYSENLPEVEFLREERKMALYKAMNRIKDEYRIAVHLVYLDELSYEEAGKVMGKSKKQIENLVYRGKQELRKILEGEIRNEN